MCVRRIATGRSARSTAAKREAFSASNAATSITSGAPSPTTYWFVPGPVMRPGFGASTTRSAGTPPTLATRCAIANAGRGFYESVMTGWDRVSLLAATGTLRAPGQVADDLRGAGGPVIFTGHRFGTVPPFARLLCRHLAGLRRPWAIESTVAISGDRDLLRLARRSGCRALLLGPEPDPLGRDSGPDALDAAIARLRAIRRAGVLTVVAVTLGRDGDDAGVFGRAVRLCVAGRVAFPQLAAEPSWSAMSRRELEDGLAWARRALHSHRAIHRRTGLLHARSRAALLANYRTRRDVFAEPAPGPTPAMR